MVDLIIRNGTVVDGTGADPFEADVAIDGGKIVAVGEVAGRGIEEIDARGLLVTPGFVDPHTHYDGQATWSSRITPSSWNGVTTTLFGNCGVGFAPCKPSQRDMLVKLMEGVEDIPEVGADRRPAMELAEFSRLPRCAGRASLRHGHRDAGAARRAARVRHGRARRRPRACHRAGSRRDGTSRRGRDQGGCSGFLHVAHAEPQDAGRPFDPDAECGRGRACRDRRCAARHRRRLDAGDLRLRRCGGRVRHAAAPGRRVAAADGDHDPAARQQARGVAPARRLDRRSQCRRTADARPGADTSDRHPAGLRDLAEPVRQPAELPADRVVAVRTAHRDRCANPSSAHA